jgi:hypothetical protein
MMKIRALLGVVLAACLASACVIVVDGDDAKDVSVDVTRGRPSTCEAAAHASLVGKAEREIDRSSLPSAFRIVCHDCQVTQDYAPNRLNIQLDKDNRVASVRCG